MTRNYNIPFRTKGYSETIRIPQYDTGYMIVFEMVDLPTGTTDLEAYTAVVEGARSDGLAYSFNCLISGTTVTFQIDTTCTGVPGKGEARLKFSYGNELYATLNILIEIVKSPVPDGAVDADATAAQTAAQQCQSIVNNATATITQNVEDAVSVHFSDPNNDGNIVITIGS